MPPLPRSIRGVLHQRRRHSTPAPDPSPRRHMSEPATRAPGADESGGGHPPGGPRFPRSSPTLRVAGTIPADVDHVEQRRDVRARRPSVIGALVNARALERALRVVSLLAVDFAALL